jgi:hypothetical protein
MTNEETIQKIKLALRRGDQMEIARQTGLSKAWVNQILNCKKRAANLLSQKEVIDAAFEIIKKHRISEDSNSKENSEKVKTILG